MHLLEKIMESIWQLKCVNMRKIHPQRPSTYVEGVIQQPACIGNYCLTSLAQKTFINPKG